MTPAESGPADPDTVAAARSLTRRFGHHVALDAVDLDVRAGEFLTIFGPNGAGKTTLLRTLATLLRPTSGSISLFGIDPRREPEWIRSRLGLIAHSGLLYGGMSARDNLIFYGRMYSVPDPAGRAARLLTAVGLQDRTADLVRTYSRGMLQRLGIARALMHEPELVLLDEPYTGLDQHAARMLRGLLGTLSGEGRTVIMVTHQLEEGLEISSRLMIMARGRIEHDAPAAGMTRASLERLYHDVVDGAAA